MPEYTLKYADPRGEIHQQVAIAANEREVRDRLYPAGLPHLLHQAPRRAARRSRRASAARSRSSISKSS